MKEMVPVVAEETHISVLQVKSETSVAEAWKFDVSALLLVRFCDFKPVGAELGVSTTHAMWTTGRYTAATLSKYPVQYCTGFHHSYRVE